MYEPKIFIWSVDLYECNNEKLNSTESINFIKALKKTSQTQRIREYIIEVKVMRGRGRPMPCGLLIGKYSDKGTAMYTREWLQSQTNTSRVS